jgi:poly-gamma-glutamate synthesis protein (capsule biosynthesis protein)
MKILKIPSFYPKYLSVFYPLPEWKAIFRTIADLGAAVVIGHHPHVIQAHESYKESNIFYSLGNFYFDTQLDTPETSVGYALSLEVSGRKIKNYQLVPIKASKNSVECATAQEAKNCISATKIFFSSRYEHVVNTESLKLLYTRYIGYYWCALTGIRVKNNFLQVFFVFIKLCMRKPLLNQLFFLHNIRIESHRWVVERALQFETDKNIV